MKLRRSGNTEQAAKNESAFCPREEIAGAVGVLFFAAMTLLIVLRMQKAELARSAVLDEVLTAEGMWKSPPGPATCPRVRVRPSRKSSRMGSVVNTQNGWTATRDITYNMVHKK